MASKYLSTLVDTMHERVKLNAFTVKVTFSLGEKHIRSDLKVTDGAHDMKQNYATNNHSSPVCTETEKKKGGKKTVRQTL